MKQILEISSLNNHELNGHDELKVHISESFTRPHKRIASKYFYDDYGSDLFNQITQHNDYYLTNTELEILRSCQEELKQQLSFEPVNLIDLGPGSGEKTTILMQALVQHDMLAAYIPIDISTAYLEKLAHKLKPQFPTIPFMGIHADYFKGLDWLKHRSNKRNLILFLGSSIGNFNPMETKIFLEHIHATVNANDFILVGFDLCKDIHTLMRAYNDNAGLTRAFNFNLLHRLNRELHAHFDVRKFHHYPTYNVHTKAMESYLISLEKQTIVFDDLEKAFTFDYMEPIHVECSYKYKVDQIEEFAKSTGFNVIANFFDKKHYFLDSLWSVAK